MKEIDLTKANLTGSEEVQKESRLQSDGNPIGPPPSSGFSSDTKVNALKDYKTTGQDLVLKAQSSFPEIDSSKPSICMIGWHSCIRVTKESLPLRNKGYRLGLISNRIPAGRDIFDKLYIYSDEEQLARELEEVKGKYDIYHVHNEPNILLIKAREILGPDAKIVLDVHDLDILRRGFCFEDEILGISYCSGMVHVSEPIRQYVNSIFKIDEKEKPSITLESRCPSSFIPSGTPSIKQGIIYEGGIRPPEVTAEFSYRNIWPICYAFASAGYPIEYMGPIDDNLRTKYEEAGVKCIGGYEYANLLKKLVNYQWGLSGFVQDPPKKHITWAMTNKMFEYINCGVPVIVYNTEEQSKFISHYNIGITLNSIHNIKDQIEKVDWNVLYENVKKYRFEISMDNYIDRLENLYYRLLN